MDNNASDANKLEVSILHQKFIAILQKHCHKNGTGIIEFPEINRVSSWLYHLNRSERNCLLDEMQRLGLIKIRAFHGIVIKGKGDHE